MLIYNIFNRINQIIIAILAFNKQGKVMMTQKSNETIDQTLLQAEAMKAQLELSLQFKKNMLFFSQNSPRVYEQYKNYQPENQKVFYDTKGYVNLLNIKSQKPVFEENPVNFAKNRVKDFIEKPSKFNLGYKHVETWNEKHIHLELTNSLLDEYNALNINDNPASMEIMGFVVMIGCGLGYHITELIKSKNVQNLYIYDGNKDSFYASLYTTDWEFIIRHIKGKGGVIKLTVGETCFHALSSMRNLAKEIGLFNIATSYVFMHTRSEDNLLFFNSYRKDFHLNGAGMGFFDDEQVSFAHTIANIQAKLPVFFPSSNTSLDLPPVILVGNGPSLDNLEEFIKSNQEHCLIVSCGSAINSLFKMGIKPDIHIEMERSRTIAIWRSKDIDPAYLKSIPLLVLNTISPETIALFKEARMAIKPNDLGGILMKQELSKEQYFELGFCNPTVANCAITYIGNLGFKEIYLAGTDFGMVSPESHHSKHSVHSNITKIFHTSKNDATADYTYSEGQYPRPGNFVDEVFTTNTLDMARSNIEYYLKSNSDIICYNPNNGIKIDGAITVKPEDLPSFAKNFDKPSIISALFSENFIEIDSRKFDKSYIKNKHINPIFKVRNGFLLPDNCNNITDLHKHLTRIFTNLKHLEEKGLACHLLIVGSTQVHLALLYFYCSRTKDKNSFQECFDIGKNKYHLLMDKLLAFIKERPFELDDSTVTFK